MAEERLILNKQARSALFSAVKISERIHMMIEKPLFLRAIELPQK